MRLEIYLNIGAIHKLDVWPYCCYVTKNGNYVSGTIETAYYFISREDREDAYWIVQEVSDKIDKRTGKLIPFEKKVIVYLYPQKGIFLISHFNGKKKRKNRT